MEGRIVRVRREGMLNDVVLMLETLRVLFLPESTQGFTTDSVDEFVKSFEEAVDSAKKSRLELMHNLADRPH